MNSASCLARLALVLLTSHLAAFAADPTIILHHGKIVTVDQRFSIQEAIAIADGRILATGPDTEILKLSGPGTQVIDLKGRMVMPGLMDSHAHSAHACMTEFEHALPTMETIRDVLNYIRERAGEANEGEWIILRQVFITRLKEQRYPTKGELDKAAPRNPVLFATGPDASLNSLALKLSGIDKDFKVTDGGTGFAERAQETGEPTGILRNCTRYVKVPTNSVAPTIQQKAERLQELFADYNSVGMTTICERDASPDDVELYRYVREEGRPTVRVRISRHVDSIGPIEEVVSNIRKVATDPLFQRNDDWLQVIGIKTYLDGGMLTGSAYMRRPWGVSQIYSIRDPEYRGVLFIPKERLVPMVRAAVESGLQFTAHSVGDGAVHTLLDAYEEVNKTTPVRKTHPCISHSNFMSPEAVEQAARLGVMMDIQPAWLYHDGHTLLKQFGYERLSYFQPLRSLFEAGAIAGGGSDHMQKIGSFRSVNIYNPFLGMATAITRQPKNTGKKLHPEQALTREQAIRVYTSNNSRLLGCEDRLGSLESGKLADFIVLDTDLLTCAERNIAKTKVLQTYIGGLLVHQAKAER